MGRFNRMDTYLRSILLFMERNIFLIISGLLLLNIFLLYKMWPHIVLLYYLYQFSNNI